MNILVNGVPTDVVETLDVRAKRNYRSRTGEILAILAATCRGGEGIEKGESAERGEVAAKRNPDGVGVGRHAMISGTGKESER